MGNCMFNAEFCVPYTSVPTRHPTPMPPTSVPTPAPTPWDIFFGTTPKVMKAKESAKHAAAVLREAIRAWDKPAGVQAQVRKRKGP
jgi:hypothetical protein